MIVCGPDLKFIYAHLHSFVFYWKYSSIDNIYSVFFINPTQCNNDRYFIMTERALCFSADNFPLQQLASRPVQPRLKKRPSWRPFCSTQENQAPEKNGSTSFWRGPFCCPFWRCWSILERTFLARISWKYFFVCFFLFSIFLFNKKNFSSSVFFFQKQLKIFLFIFNKFIFTLHIKYKFKHTATVCLFGYSSNR